jgi:hypothetical protein
MIRVLDDGGVFDVRKESGNMCACVCLVYTVRSTGKSWYRSTESECKYYSVLTPPYPVLWGGGWVQRAARTAPKH